MINQGLMAALLNPLHSTVVDWYRRVQANATASIPIKYETLWAADKFVRTINNNGLSSSLHTFNFFAYENLIAARTPLIRTSGNALWNTIGSGSHTLNIDGYYTSGSGYIQTGIFSSDFSTTASNMLFAYVSNDDSSSAQIEIGVANSATTQNNRLFCHTSNGTTRYDAFASNTVTSGVTGSLFNGFVCGVKQGTGTGSLSHYIYKANSTMPLTVVASGSSNAGTVPGNTVNQLYIFGSQEAGGSVQNESKKRLSCVDMGSGMDSASVQVLYNAVQQLRIDLGGGYA